MKTILAILALSLIALAPAARAQSPTPGNERKVVSREDILTKEEGIWLRALKEHDPEFLYTGKVRRYYFVDAQGNEEVFRNEIQFQTEGGFIVDKGKPTENTTYQAVFSRSSQGSAFVVYSFSAKGYNVDATAIVNKDGVSQTTYSCGVSSCGFEVKQDGQALKVPKRKA